MGMKPVMNHHNSITLGGMEVAVHCSKKQIMSYGKC